MAELSAAEVAKPLSAWTMDELLQAYPGAREVLARHGIDPLKRCNVAVRGRFTLKQLLGRTCRVDDAAATLQDLKAFMAQTPPA